MSDQLTIEDLRLAAAPTTPEGDYIFILHPEAVAWWKHILAVEAAVDAVGDDRSLTRAEWYILYHRYRAVWARELPVYSGDVGTLYGTSVFPLLGLDSE